jgi:uncharacterized protein (TIGR02001 family)
MRFSHISLGALALAIASPALADPLPAAAGATTANDAGAPVVDAMTPVGAAVADDAPVAPAAPADDAPAKPASAFTITGGATLTSDYRFRGLTQSNEKIVMQATLGVSHKSGFYVGTWASQIDGGLDGSTPALRGYGSAEVDLYGGFTRTLKNGLGFDVGLLYYYYPTGKDGIKTDFFEPYASANYTVGPLNVKAGLNYAWGNQAGLDFTSGNDDDLYVYGEFTFGVPKTPLSIKGHLGHTSGSLGLVNPTASDTYTDWSLTAEVVGGPMKFGVSYVDTNISEVVGDWSKGTGDTFTSATTKFAQFFGRGATVLAYVSIGF